MYSNLEVLVFLPQRLYVNLVLGGPGVSHFQGAREIMESCANVTLCSRSLRVIAGDDWQKVFDCGVVGDNGGIWDDDRMFNARPLQLRSGSED